MTILQTIQAAQNWWVRVTENFTAVSPAAMYSLDPASSNLNLKIKGGLYGTTTVADYDTALTASSGANYVVMSRADGSISRATNTTNWSDATNYMRIGIATAGATTFTWVDHRPGREEAGSGGGPANTDALPEGSTNLYFTAARVRASVLTGLSLATGGAIAATDTVLQALGKLQKSLTDGLSAAAAAGAVGSSGLTMATARLLGRWGAGSGAIQEVTIGSGLNLDGSGVLTATSSGGMTNPMTTAGDLIVGGSAGAPERLGIGSASQQLRVNAGGTALEYYTPSSGGSGDVTGPVGSADKTLARYFGTTGKVIQASGVIVTDLDEISAYKATIRVASGTTDTLLAADSGCIVEYTSATAVAVTLPNSLPKGWNATLVQAAAGQVTVSAGAGATLANRYSQYKTSGQWAEVTLYIRSNSGSNAAGVLAGDTST